jgi:uncharacterized protein
MTGSGSGVPVRVLVPGSASGPVLVLEEPLSFWGGLDPETGRIIDARHPQAGRSVAGRVLLMPSSRGSSSSSSVLAEAIRQGTAPVAIVLGRVDTIVAVGALIATELYDRGCPVVVMAPSDYKKAARFSTLEVDAGETQPRARFPTRP